MFQALLFNSARIARIPQYACYQSAALPSTSYLPFSAASTSAAAAGLCPSWARSISITGIKNPKTKMKTHKGTAKRWTPIASGQYKRGRPGKRHLNLTLSSDRLNKLGQTAYANPAQKRVLKKLLPGL